MANEDMRDWIRQDLESFLPKEGERLTFNGRMRPELEDCDEDSRTLTLKFPMQDWEVNGIGTLHGGLISCMADLTMSIVLRYYMKGGIPPTISMTVNYMKTVPLDGYALVRARVTSVGRRVGTGCCEVIVPSTGKVAATAIGTFATV